MPAINMNRHNGTGRQRHGRRRPKAFNGHEANRRKRRIRQRDPEPVTRQEHIRRALKGADGRAEGHPKNEDERTLADLAGRWAINRLGIDSDNINAKWCGNAADLQAWGEFIPSTGTVKLAENHPDLLSMLWTTLHECVHARQKEDGELPPAWSRTPDATEKLEKETDEATADLLDEFLLVLDTSVMREQGIRSLTYDDIFPNTEPIPA